MTMSTKFKGLFWRDATVPPPAAQPQPPPVARPTADGSAPMDFAAIYERTNTTGDPKADQVLLAFEGMKAAMAAPELAIAITATAKAIGADTGVIVKTFARRLTALDAAITDERQRMTVRGATRTEELHTATSKVHADISAMKQKIATLEQQLAAATTQVQELNAREHSLVAAFEQRARVEAARLIELREFLQKGTRS